MTLKKAMLRGLIGIPAGVFISQLVLLVVSLGWGEGKYLIAAPEFIAYAGGEVAASGLQFLFSCIIGFAFAVASCVFEVEHWGITKQTVLHLIILGGVFFPIALFLRWVSFTLSSVGRYFLIWIAIYAIIWGTQFSALKRKTGKLNEKLKRN